MSSSSEKKRKTMTETTNLLSLPDDLLMSCFSRVSRLYHPTLSLVSKSFRSLLASPELYKNRSLSRRTETCLYVCLRFPSEPNPRWYTLCHKPDRNDTIKKTTKRKKKKKSSGYVLASVSIQNAPFTYCSRLVAVGSNIYNIGGPVKNDTPRLPSSNVSVLDCRSHTWREAPSMSVERMYGCASVVDGKIYVVGGCKDCDFIEVFDPKTQSWDHVPCPYKIDWNDEFKGACIDGKFHMMSGRREGLAYSAEEGKWDLVEEVWRINGSWVWFPYCTIENVLYSYSFEGIKWYNSEVKMWQNLKGLEGLPNFANYGIVRLADYGGKLVVLWDKYLRTSGYKEKRIWCAEITLERRESGEMWGKIEWLDGVLTVPQSYAVVNVLGVTL